MNTSKIRFALFATTLCTIACDPGGGSGGDTDGATDGDTESDESGGGGGPGGNDSVGTTSGSGEDTDADDSDSAGDTDGDDSDSAGDTDGDDPPEDQAYGVITLAEAHPSGGGTASGSVSAFFLPDSDLHGTACTETVAGCEISVLPDCPAGCGEDQYCGFDGDCESTCQDICDAECEDDEVCYFAAPGQAACREIEDFDAGALAFSGTTTPITLFPPYTSDGFDSGSPFLPGSDVTVSASGATDAGLEAFEASFTATTLLESEIGDISAADAYGAGDMPVVWDAGSDDIIVSLTVSSLDGDYGTVTCNVDDEGSFDVPRQAIEAAIDGQSAAAISVSLTRQRTERVDGIATVGELLFEEVQPEAAVDLVTSSTESATVEGCGPNELICGSDCVDVTTSDEHCGECDNACEGGCVAGECVPTSWNCDISFYGAGDGCDCGCGAQDPDCGSSSSGVCEYCIEPGSCATESCEEIDPNDNAQCIECDGSEVLCGGTCTDTQSSDQHCGGCDQPCDGACVDGDCLEGFENTDATCSDNLDNDGDTYFDCDDFDCADTAVCGGAGVWSCSEDYYGTDDGCDCGCGIVDPDCGSSSADVCEYCSGDGYCGMSCDDIDPDDNSQCAP